MRIPMPAALLIVALNLSSSEARAQALAPALELSGAYAAFVDDARLDHAAIGAAFSFPVTPRLSVGPELVFMIGPGGDRDLFISGNLRFDLVRSRGSRPAPVVPYLVVGGGTMAHRDTFWNGSFVSWEGSVAGGGGVRVALTDRFTIGGEVRAGWEPHVRVTGVLGIRLGPVGPAARSQ